MIYNNNTKFPRDSPLWEIWDKLPITVTEPYSTYYGVSPFGVKGKWGKSGAVVEAYANPIVRLCFVGGGLFPHHMGQKTIIVPIFI